MTARYDRWTISEHILRDQQARAAQRTAAGVLVEDDLSGAIGPVWKEREDGSDKARIRN